MNSLFYILIILGILSGQTKIQDNDWTHTARLAAGGFWPEMSDYEMHDEIDKLIKSGVNVIDVDISWSELDLAVPFLERVSSYTHFQYPDTKIFTYIAPLEYIFEGVDQDQDGQVDPGKTSLFTEHPDWLQVGIDGRPAVFYGSLAFWIGPYDEDVWLCPNDPTYKEEVWAEMVEELAGTGINGMYMDVPFFLFWFGENWDEQWSCHCSDCDTKFFIETGSYIPDSIDL